MHDYLYSQYHQNQIQTQIINKILKHAKKKISKPLTMFAVLFNHAPLKHAKTKEVGNLVSNTKSKSERKLHISWHCVSQVYILVSIRAV
jgi:hypothetical protein